VSGTWVRTYENGADYIESLGGAAWSAGEPPQPWHRCRAQTRGRREGDYIERCRCGAMRLNHGPWAERNRTRQDRLRARRDGRAPKEQVTCRECGQPYEAVAGSAIAAERQCNGCWADHLVRGRW
jgi:hypothetical protein